MIRFFLFTHTYTLTEMVSTNILLSKPIKNCNFPWAFILEMHINSWAHQDEKKKTTTILNTFFFLTRFPFLWFWAQLLNELCGYHYIQTEYDILLYCNKIYRIRANVTQRNDAHVRLIHTHRWVVWKVCFEWIS